MSGVDSRIVTMKFENTDFQKGATTTLSTLEKLKEALSFKGSSRGAADSLNQIQQAARGFHLGTVEGAVTHVSKSFLAMSTVAITALSRITDAGITAGVNFAKSFTTAPIKDGLREYETTLNSVQTILANTGLVGQKGMNKVNAALQELNTYSDKTIYNFSEMARNVGTFTAAGVKLKTSVAAIKGIANVAAVSGVNATDAARGMYQLSQALASGTVRLQDWRSVETAGFGGKVFQEAIKETARVHGIHIDAMIKKEGSFRNTLKSGWLTSKVLTESLSKFTGELTDEQLKAQGYTDKQIAGIQRMAKTAVDAATKVKTFSQLLGTLKESIGSGWAQTFQLLLGDFGQAKTMFTSINNVLGGMILNASKSRNALLAQWKSMGGRDLLIKGVSDAFHNLLAIMKPIREAFREIFPAKTAQDLLNATRAFANFADSLKISDETSANLKRTFAGVFAVFDILKQVIGGVVSAFGMLFGAAEKGSGGFLEFTGGIGDFLVALDQALRKSGAIKSFFTGLASIIAIPLAILKSLGKFIGAIFSGFGTENAKNVTDALDAVGQKLSPLQAMAQRVGNFFKKLGGIFSSVGGVIFKAIQGIGAALGKMFTPETFSQTLAVINTALLGGILLLFKNFFSKGLTVNLGKGMFGQVKNTLGAVTGAMKAMQAQIKADVIMKIAIALGILTASILVLSTINPKKLATAMAGLTAGFAGLAGALAVLTKIVSGAGALKLPFITAALMGLSSAMLIMAGALKIMASIPADKMLRGLAGMAALFVILTKAVGPLSKNAGGMIRAAAGIFILATALNIMAVALKLMASMSWEAMGQGLAGVAGALTIVAGAMRLMPKGMLLQAAALLAVGGALNAIAVALKIFASIKWEAMGRGMVALAGSLVIIAGAMRLMPATLPITAAGLVLVGVALNIIAGALKIMGGMSWEAIGKGLVTLAGSLAILAAGLYLMSGALPGAAALLIASAALAVLTPVMIALGSLDWMTIVKGLTALAGIFVVLGAAGFVLAPLVPVLIGLGAAMVLIGAGLALAGAGATAFATAFSIVVAAGTAGVGVIQQMLSAIIKSIPAAMKAFGEGLVAFAGAIAKGAPALVNAFAKIASSMLDALIKVVPKIGQAITALLHTIVGILVNNIPMIVSAGFKLITGLLTGIRNNIGAIVTIVGQIVVKFLDALGRQLPKVIAAGVRFIINFMNGLSKAIDDNSAEVGAAAARLGVAIVEGMVKGIAGGLGVVTNAAKNLAHSALDAAKGALGIHSPSKEFQKVGQAVGDGFVKGLDGSQADVEKTLTNLRGMLRDQISKSHDDIQRLKDHLETLQKVKKKNQDVKEIKKTQAAIAQVTAEHQKGKDALDVVTKGQKANENQLWALGKQYDDYTQQIKDATDALDAAKKAQEDFAKSTADSYSKTAAIPDDPSVSNLIGTTLQTEADQKKLQESLDHLRTMGLDTDTYNKLLKEGAAAQPVVDTLLKNGPASIAEANQISKTIGDALSGYEGSLVTQLAETQKFKDTLATLVNMGLDDASYKKFLDEGIGIQPFLDELVAGGPGAVASISRLTTALGVTAKDLGTTTAAHLYQAGVDSAQGLLDGLKKSQKDIADQMTGIGKIMVRAIRKALKIKSPSREMLQIGKFTNMGLADGIDKYSHLVENSATTMANNTVDTIKQTMRGISATVNTEVNSNPVIAPVLDLSGVQKGASEISNMLATKPISASISYDQAASISAARDAAAAAQAAATETAAVPQTVVNFEQTNNSPKALSPVEIYRQTKNQLSLAREALNAP